MTDVGRVPDGTGLSQGTMTTNTLSDELVETVARAMTATRGKLAMKRFGPNCGWPRLWDEYTDEGKQDALEEARAALSASGIERIQEEASALRELLDEAFDMLGGIDDAIDLRGRILGLSADMGEDQ